MKKLSEEEDQSNQADQITEDNSKAHLEPPTHQKRKSSGSELIEDALHEETKDVDNKENNLENTGNVYVGSSFEISENNSDFKVEIIPKRLKKTFKFSIGLFIVGLLLIMFGSFFLLYEYNLTKAFTFYILGGIVLIPGSYFSLKFYQLYKAKDEYERNNILDQIPEL